MASELAAASNGWREPVLATLDGAQRGWLATLNALGWTEPIDGQPAWPHAWRFSAQVLGYDDGLLRQLVLAATASLLAVLALACAALALRRWRSQQRRQMQYGEPAAHVSRLGAVIWPMVLAAALLWLMPWPAAHLWLTPAVPTSFHRAPAPFSAQHIVAGQALYARHCASCHGATGRGDGPQAEREVAQGGVWPPMLVGGLLGKRLEGELLWRARHGWSEADSTAGRGRVAHNFSAQLSTAQTWQVLDFLSASAAGQNLVEAGNWPQPVRLPQLTTLAPFASGAAQSLAAHRLNLPALAAAPQADSNWLTSAHAKSASRAATAASTPTPAHGENARCAHLLAQSPRTRLVFAQADGSLPPTPALQPDGRLLTVLVLPPGSTVAQATAASATSSHPASLVIDCQIQNADFSAAMALLLGVSGTALPGHQVLSDREGWLRARSAPGAPGWQEGDLICKPASSTPEASTATPQGTGLDALIARMDATPLALTRAGFVAHR